MAGDAAPQPVRTAAAATKEREKGEVLCVEVSTEATPRSDKKEADYVPVSFWRLFRCSTRTVSLLPPSCSIPRVPLTSSGLAPFPVCSHATTMDWSLMALGTLGAMANGEWLSSSCTARTASNQAAIHGT